MWLTEVARRESCGRAVIAADVMGRAAFSLLGIWSNAPSSSGYVDDVLRSPDAYSDVLRGRPTVVMGDLNSGTQLNGSAEVSESHRRLLSAFAALDMVSAYHAAHNVEHGREAHSTYRHPFNEDDPWHIDFCFVPRTCAQNTNGVTVTVIDGGQWRAPATRCRC